MEFADGGFLDQKVWQVFVVLGWCCDELLEWSFGGLER